MKSLIKSILNRFPHLKKIILRQYEYNQHIKPILKARKNKNMCFLVLTPIHGNLGDHAIALSEIELLKKLAVTFYEISGNELIYLHNKKKLGILNGSPIIVNGGGNLGTLWFDVELQFRDLIMSNPDSSILLMPNTFYYEDSSFGESELLKSIHIYNSHKALYLCARERFSYYKMKAIYNNVELIPDMAFSLNKQTKDKFRKGCILCLRKDIEKTILVDEVEKLYSIVNEMFDYNVELSDTVVKRIVPFEKREEELEFIWEKFRGSELVITDRLHGMIFAAITGTPCIVLNSKSPKVKGCFEWIKDLGYIVFCENLSDIPEIYRRISSVECKYDNSQFMPYYQKLEKKLKSVVQ